MACRGALAAGPFPANSLLAVLERGGCPEPWLFAHLWAPGPGRAVSVAVLRRVFSHLLDSGGARAAPARDRRFPALVAGGALLAVALWRKRRA